MTIALSAREVAQRITERWPRAVIEAGDTAVLVDSNSLLDIASFLKNTPGLEFDYLNHITGVDYFQYFEVVYLLTSIKHNHSITLKARCYGRDNPSLPSVVSLWQGADYQEREIYDLMGVRFEGHPNMKRIVLWSGYPGHPLRKDFLE
jgi:NADH-quinone oxidoreductase subunit C